jgi:hypothetical protein
MTTAADIAASRQSQEQESLSRQPLDDAGNRIADPIQTLIADDVDPQDPSQLGDERGQPQQRERRRPIYMSPSDEARQQIAKRFKRDDEGNVPFNGDPNDPEMQYGKFGRAEPEPEPELEPEPEPVRQQQPQEKLYTIKVRGKDVTLTEAQLLERAAKVEAADSYLAEGRDLLEQARQARRDNAERDRSDPHRPEDQDNTQDDVLDPSLDADPQHPGDELVSAIEEIQYGDPKEAAGKIRKAITKEADKAADDRQLQRLRGNDSAKSAKAMKAFIEANPEIANDKRASQAMENELYDIQREEMIALGLDELKLPKSTTDIALWHQFYRIHGHPVSAPDQMLNEAKSRFDKWRGVSSNGQPQQQRKPAAPRVEVNVDRNARRAQLPNQPTRTMVPPQLQRSQQQTGPKDRSSTIMEMRRSRGQIVG